MIKEIFNFKKSDDLIQLLGTYEVKPLHIQVAESVANSRLLTNLVLGTEQNPHFSNGNSDRTYFMSLLTEIHFSILLKNFADKKTIISIPELVSLDLKKLKGKQDCSIEKDEIKIELDIKSQYASHKYKNMNVNEGHFKRSKDCDGMFIFSVINTDSYEEKEDFKNVKSITNYVVKNEFVEKFGQYKKLNHRYDGFYQCAFSKF